MSTEIVFILDRSGSMSNLVEDVIGGFNSFVAEQKKLSKKIKLTTVLFDDKYEILHDGVDIKDIKPITDKEYFARGWTALLDAVGKSITNLKVKKSSKVLFVINTDGLENFSKEYTYETVKNLVEEKKKQGWEFMFVGANIDSFAVGASLGINITANYSATQVGTKSFYDTVSSVVSGYAHTGSVDTTLLDNIK